MSSIMAQIKKMGLAIFCLLILFFSHGNLWADSIHIDSKAAILIDQTTGKVLFEKNCREKLPIASTTKILTSIIGLELADLQEEITVSNYVASIGEASIDLLEGERINLQNLLLGTMLNSGNDAAVAIAELVAGSEEDFINIMNKKAKLIGAYNSNFANPNGLPGMDHYATAHDLALIARYAMENSVLKEIVRIKTATIPYGDKGWTRYLKNTNKLLWKYSEATGIKTGTTDAAGPCLVASAERNGTKLIAVVLNSKDRFGESQKLLKWGLDNYQTVTRYNKGEYITALIIPGAEPEILGVKARETLIFSMKNGENVTEEITWNELKLPIAPGDSLGEIISWVGSEQYMVELVAANSMRQKTFWEKLWIKRNNFE